MRWSDVLLAGLLLCVTLVPGLARADDELRLRAQDALDRTDRRIELADNFVNESPSAPAATELGAAHQGQTRARSSFTATQYALAVGATLAAREHADRAISIVRNLPDPNRVQMQVERTREVIERARDRVGACDDTRARGMLRVALTMQERAEGAMAESRYLAALQLTMSARERVMKAMRLCNVDESVSDSATGALQRTDEVLAGALESMNGNSSSAARELLGRAQSIQTQAHAEARLERYESALRLTQGARALAQRAIRPGRRLQGSAGR